MNFIEIDFYVVLVGFLAWCVQALPISAPFKNIAVGVLIFGLIFWLLQSFGLLHGFAPLRLR